MAFPIGGDDGAKFLPRAQMFLEHKILDGRHGIGQRADARAHDAAGAVLRAAVGDVAALRDAGIHRA